MKNLNRNEMNAVLGGGRKTVTHIKVYKADLTPKEKAWYEKAWDEIKSWF